MLPWMDVGGLHNGYARHRLRRRRGSRRYSAGYSLDGPAKGPGPAPIPPLVCVPCRRLQAPPGGKPKGRDEMRAELHRFMVEKAALEQGALVLKKETEHLASRVLRMELRCQDDLSARNMIATRPGIPMRRPRKVRVELSVDARADDKARLPTCCLENYKLKERVHVAK